MSERRVYQPKRVKYQSLLFLTSITEVPETLEKHYTGWKKVPHLSEKAQELMREYFDMHNFHKETYAVHGKADPATFNKLIGGTSKISTHEDQPALVNGHCSPFLNYLFDNPDQVLSIEGAILGPVLTDDRYYPEGIAIWTPRSSIEQRDDSVDVSSIM